MFIPLIYRLLERKGETHAVRSLRAGHWLVSILRLKTAPGRSEILQGEKKERPKAQRRAKPPKTHKYGKTVRSVRPPSVRLDLAVLGGSLSLSLGLLVLVLLDNLGLFLARVAHLSSTLGDTTGRLLGRLGTGISSRVALLAPAHLNRQQAVPLFGRFGGDVDLSSDSIPLGNQKMVVSNLGS